MDSILNSVKQQLGLDVNYVSFDQELIMHINSVLVGLRQMGIGPQDSAFTIHGSGEKWSDMLGTDYSNYQEIVSYVGLKVKKIFDPPASGAVMDALTAAITEFEWRLNVQADFANSFE